jgi:hypothetical protein
MAYLRVSTRSTTISFTAENSAIGNSRSVALSRSRKIPAITMVQAEFTARAAGDKTLRIAFIGAGGINFGSPEGPWNHSARLQQLSNVEFTAICDPYQELANQRIEALQNGISSRSSLT